MRLFGKIPFSVSSSFWIVASLIGYLSTESIIGSILWVVVIFVSVFVHEMGHALFAQLFGLTPRIELLAFGGITYYNNQKSSLKKQFLIVLMGPLFGFCLFVFSFYISHNFSIPNLFLRNFFDLLRDVNLFWTFVNFIPVLPLDGGQIIRIGLEGGFRRKGRKIAFLLSLILASLATGLCFFYGSYLFAGMLFLFSYQNYADWKKEKDFSFLDEDLSLQKSFLEAELNLRQGRKLDALQGFEVVFQKAPSSSLARLSAQYMAFLESDFGNKEKAFDLLNPYRESLSKEGLYLFQQVSFDLGHYSLVTQVSGECFQSFPFPDVAERAAKSHARQHEVKPCLGWLDTLIDLGADRSQDLILEPAFDEIREDPGFVKWVRSRLSD